MKSINKILVPLDFSVHSFTILHQAAEIARYVGAQIVILHVYHKPLLSSAMMKKLDPEVVKVLEKSRLSHLLSNIQDKYNNLIRAIPELNDTRVKFIKTKGLVVDKIVEVNAQEKIDLIIMGTRGAKGIQEFWGTKTAEICLTLRTPVLVIPYHSKHRSPDKIAFAYDLKSIRDINGLNMVKLLSQVYGAEIHIITIHRDCKITPEEVENIRHLNKHFEEFSPIIHQQCGDNIEEGLFDYLKENKISMLVALHRSRKLLEDMFHESFTERFVYHSNIPVLALDDRE
jgi:nucleotide-binding universal stress UspA family protein